MSDKGSMVVLMGLAILAAGAVLAARDRRPSVLPAPADLAGQLGLVMTDIQAGYEKSKAKSKAKAPRVIVVPDEDVSVEPAEE